MERTTPKDVVFKRAVKREFTVALNNAREMGYSAESFAATLGITRAALYKYLGEQAIPSLRVLEKARKKWKVKLNYGELGEEYITRKKASPSEQMELTFTTADISQDRITVKKVVTRDTSVEMIVAIDLAKGA